MRRFVQMWGNSLAVRLPKELALDLQLSEGTEVEIMADAGSLVITPVSRGVALLDLVARITPDNRHSEVDSGRPRGREAW